MNDAALATFLIPCYNISHITGWKTEGVGAMNLKLWDLPPVDRTATVALARECGIPPLLAALLRVRGIDTPEKVSGFLAPGEFSDPYDMKDMDRAVARIRRAMDDFEHIAIYGDYDADGVTATAMLYTYLQDKGASVSFYIPQRDSEGYGMNMAAVDTLSREGVDLIITVDNGVSANEEIAYAKSLGMDVVVTDHHQPHEALPDAPVVDAHRGDDNSSFKELCGAGVVLKLLMALEGGTDAILEQYADLAALGTVGDSVDLTGENRLIVQTGLRMAQRRERPGLAALLGSEPVTSTRMSFSVIPCINATGRMGSPERAVRLLTHQDEDSAMLLSEEIREENQNRKAVETQVVEAAGRVLEGRPELKYDRVLVVCGEDWHHGVVGIAAARLSELYGKPCIVLSEKDGEVRGSGRSVEGFNLFQAVTACRDLLLRYGGHPMAAGMTLAAGQVEEFRRRINDYARESCPEMPFFTMKLDCTLQNRALTPATCRSLEPLEPFGAGNPQPVFALLGITLTDVRGLGSNMGHCKLYCKGGGLSFECLKFGVGPGDFPYPPGSVVDLAVNLQEDHYGRGSGVEILVRDVRLSGLDRLQCQRDYRIYEKYKRREQLSVGEAGRLRPTREQLGAVYTLLPKVRGPRLGLENLVLHLERYSINMGMLLFGLELLRERGLIEYGAEGGMLTAYRLETKGKADITLSPLLKELDALTDGDGHEKE